MSDPRYPVGKFQPVDQLTDDERRAHIDTIAAAPSRLRAAVAGLDDAQLDTPYRDGGWTIRQVVHHVPDSHVNAYVRLKLALTEDNPTILPYKEAAWADVVDSRITPIDVSLTLLESLHARMVGLLRTLEPADFRRTFRHPEHEGLFSLDKFVAMYAWHSLHHAAHITSTRERHGW
ncbi:MAG: putative metal-dependent hydrolase [Acidobacteria bacterium]|nr:putative metal-dependent hydrolase [Acidobacteriota bacterium]MBV9477621.1 putative metal-dependent hydrolase [Acidobacteriota bacterium]